MSLLLSMGTKRTQIEITVSKNTHHIQWKLLNQPLSPEYLRGHQEQRVIIRECRLHARYTLAQETPPRGEVHTACAHKVSHQSKQIKSPGSCAQEMLLALAAHTLYQSGVTLKA